MSSGYDNCGNAQFLKKQGAVAALAHGKAFDIWCRKKGQGLEKRELVGRDDFETGKGAGLVVIETIGSKCGDEVHDEVVDGAVARVDERLSVLQRVVDALDDIVFAQHYLVPQRH